MYGIFLLANLLTQPLSYYTVKNDFEKNVKIRNNLYIPQIDIRHGYKLAGGISCLWNFIHSVPEIIFRLFASRIRLVVTTE